MDLHLVSFWFGVVAGTVSSGLAFGTLGIYLWNRWGD